MTEEQGTARERLEALMSEAMSAAVTMTPKGNLRKTPCIPSTRADAASCWRVLLDQLPLVLEAAQEAGKAEERVYTRLDDWSGHVWRLLDDSEEQT